METASMISSRTAKRSHAEIDAPAGAKTPTIQKGTQGRLRLKVLGKK
jgi:hypothetical protein